MSIGEELGFHATALFEELGDEYQQVDYHRASDPTFDTDTLELMRGSVLHQPRGVFLGVGRDVEREAPGVERVFLLPASEVAFVPDPQDQIVAEGKTWEILRVGRGPGDAFYAIDLRGAQAVG